MTSPHVLLALQDVVPALVPADTAWMLMSTALVLLMTPALAFFYGGLVRSKNSLNTMMMSYVALGFIGILWALIAYSLSFSEGSPVARRIQQRAAERCGPRPQGHHSAPAVHGLPGHLRHHHGGADLRRHRGAHALLALRRVHLGVAARGLRPGGPLGLGRRLAGRGSACSTSPAAPSCTSTPASRRWWPRWCSAAARTTGVRRSCRTTCRSCCSAPACSGSAGSASTAAARSRPTPRRRSAFTNTFLAPMATLVVWSHPRHRPHRSRHRGRAARPASWWASSPSRRPPASSSPIGALALGAIATFPSYFVILYRSAHAAG